VKKRLQVQRRGLSPPFLEFSISQDKHIGLDHEWLTVPWWCACL
jgi:hypothetical protein